MNRSLRIAVVPLALLVLLVTARSVWALATEHFGNAPVRPGFVDISPEARELANLKTRFYWREVNGDPTFYYAGNTQNLNEALRKLAALPGARKEVHLLPGPGEVRTLTGEKRMPCDWYVHTPAGLTLARLLKGKGFDFPDATLTVYVGAARAQPAEGRLVARLISELDSDDFEIREQASRALEKLGSAAVRAFRQTLAGKPSPEVRQRITALLGKLPAIDLDLIEIPAGVTVLDPRALAQRYTEGLNHEDYQIRGYCVGGLGTLASYEDEPITRLVALLKTDTHEYVRRYVASVLSHLGPRAAAALPVLEAGAHDPDDNIRSFFAHAVQEIRTGKPDGEGEQRRRRQAAVLTDLARFRADLEGGK